MASDSPERNPSSLVWFVEWVKCVPCSNQDFVQLWCITWIIFLKCLRGKANIKLTFSITIMVNNGKCSSFKQTSCWLFMEVTHLQFIECRAARVETTWTGCQYTAHSYLLLHTITIPPIKLRLDLDSKKLIKGLTFEYEPFIYQIGTR